MDTQHPFMYGSDHLAVSSTAPRAPVEPRRVTVPVYGLYYEHSNVGLARQLRGTAGIIDVVVDPQAGTATITFDGNLLTVRAVEYLINECGYELGSRDAADAHASGTRDAGRAARSD